jgi:hypothetical protein
MPEAHDEVDQDETEDSPAADAQHYQDELCHHPQALPASEHCMMFL